MARNNPERGIQIAVADHLRLRAKPGVVWFHVPNTPRNAVSGRNLKRMGMRAGVSDLILFHERKLFALELKAPGNVATDEQKKFQIDLSAEGASCACAVGLDAALSILTGWGLLR